MVIKGDPTHDIEIQNEDTAWVTFKDWPALGDVTVSNGDSEGEVMIAVGKSHGSKGDDRLRIWISLDRVIVSEGYEKPLTIQRRTWKDEEEKKK